MEATNGTINTSTYTPGYVLGCPSCFNQYRTECINQLLTELPLYCPYCGYTPISRTIDSTLDYWYSLAESFGLPYNQEGATLIKQLVDEWPRDTYHKFRDYFEAIMASDESEVVNG